MGKTVFVTTYEVVGAGIPIARQHFADIRDAQRSQFDFAESMGAVGYRPNHTGRIYSLFFKYELPTGFRKIAVYDGQIEAVPHKGSKIGRERAEMLSNAPKAPLAGELAAKFGWDNDYGVTDGYRIFSATAVHVLKPTERFFVRLPRQPEDGVSIPDTLREVSEGDLMRAIADHNDAVRAQDLAKAES